MSDGGKGDVLRRLKTITVTSDQEKQHFSLIEQVFNILS